MCARVRTLPPPPPDGIGSCVNSKEMPSIFYWGWERQRETASFNYDCWVNICGCMGARGGQRPRAHNTGTSVNKRAEPSKDKLIRTPQQTHTQKTHNYTRGYAQSPPSNTHAPSCFLPFPTHTRAHLLNTKKEIMC